MHHMKKTRQKSFHHPSLSFHVLALIWAMSWASSTCLAFRVFKTSIRQFQARHDTILRYRSQWMAIFDHSLPITYRSPFSSTTFVARPFIRSSHRGTADCQCRRRFFSLFATAVDDDETTEDEATTKTLYSEWNVPGLKKETQRLVLRCHKKIGKAHQRLESAQEQVNRLMKDDNASLDQLEACPNVEALQLELQELQSRLKGLNELEASFQSIKSKSSTQLPEPVAQLAIDLGVNDQPYTPPPRVTKPKSPRESSGPRLPYRRYFSFNGVEIRVGKKATDNDDLTLRPQHRDNQDWWMHASGCPGSHVIIRCHDALHPEVKLDAAALAARQSKCNTPVIKVSLTRAGDIRKPPGAKAGLVQLVGKVETVVVDMKAAQERLKRLDATVLVN